MVASWWRHGGVMVASWWRHGGVKVRSWWRQGGVMASRWRHGGAVVASVFLMHARIMFGNDVFKKCRSILNHAGNIGILNEYG